MIRVFPHAPARPWPEAVASIGVVLVWAGLRSAWAGGGWMIPALLHGGLVVGLAVLAARAYRAMRLGQEVLEVYVGKRFLELVSSRGGEEVRRTSLELVRLEDAVAERRAVRLLVEGGEPVAVPMALHSDEARGWMVEHLRGAGLGARRRYGHLPLAAGTLQAEEHAGSSVVSEDAREDRP